MLDLVTIGETMVSFVPKDGESIRYSTTFGRKVAGAESNVAIGIAKLGKKSGWISKLGNDEFAEIILRELKAEGVDVSRVKKSDKPTGLMFKQFNCGLNNETSVTYYRDNSAARTLGPLDIPEDYVKNSRLIHLTGITTVLSESCNDAIHYLFKLAKKNNIPISFDPNIRQKLWDPIKDKQNISNLVKNADIVLLGLSEATLLFDLDDADKIINLLRENGVKKIALKNGEHGAIVADEQTIYKIPAVSVKVVDSVGAGDAFNSGFLFGLLENNDIKKCGEIGSILGASAVSSYGDIEGLPDYTQLMDMLNNRQHVYR